MASGYNPRNEKSNPRILSSDVYTFISKNTSLNASQVKEVFSCYGQLLRELAKNKHRKSGFTIPLPTVGVFEFKNVKGNKKGDIIKMPDPKEDYSVIIDLVIEEDKPNYQKLYFKVGVALQNLIREVTSTYE